MILTEQRLAELAGLSESLHHEGEVSSIEEGLRKAIRAEIEKVLAEVLAERDHEVLQYAQKKKSIGAAMGFAGVGFSQVSRRSPQPSNSHPNTSTSRTLGFTGPGL